MQPDYVAHSDSTNAVRSVRMLRSRTRDALRLTAFALFVLVGRCYFAATTGNWGGWPTVITVIIIIVAGLSIALVVVSYKDLKPHLASGFAVRVTKPIRWAYDAEVEGAGTHPNDNDLHAWQTRENELLAGLVTEFRVKYAPKN